MKSPGVDGGGAQPPGTVTYCAQDCLVTYELLASLRPRLDALSQGVYDFERACQAPALAMMLRGMRRDPMRAIEAVRVLGAQAREHQEALQRAGARFDYLKAWAPSPQALARWLYGELGLSVKRDRKTGQPTTNEEALGRLKADPKCPDDVVPLIDAVLALRAADKEREVLTQKADPDGRVRCSWSVGATETGRWSCSKSPMGGGGNFQAFGHEVRRAFVPDTGKVMIYADLKQAESNVVAHLAGDPAYVAAHLEGDTHTLVARRIWLDLGDQVDLRKECPPWDAKQPWRQWAKRVQHAANYGQSHVGMARLLHIPQREALNIQKAYFGAFRGIGAWHDRVKEELALRGELTSPLGRRRQFLGRPWDADTQREALAYLPQSTVGDLLNLGLLRAWEALDPHGVQFLAQGHDSVLFQCEEARAEEMRKVVVEMLQIPVVVGPRTMRIGADSKVGGDWGEASS